MTQSRNDPDSSRAVALSVELRVLTGKLRRRLREETQPGEWTTSQKSAILRLERDGPATVTTLARAEGMRPQSMGAIVSVLRDQGMLQASPDPEDGRQTLFDVTPACRTIVLARRAAWEDWLFRMIQARFTPDEQEDLAKAVVLLKRLVDP